MIYDDASPYTVGNSIRCRCNSTSGSFATLQELGTSKKVTATSSSTVSSSFVWTGKPLFLKGKIVVDFSNFQIELAGGGNLVKVKWNTLGSPSRYDKIQNNAQVHGWLLDYRSVRQPSYIEQFYKFRGNSSVHYVPKT